jgi:phosphoglycolate phosphatase-like HAD superfamily hydrolase
MKMKYNWNAHQIQVICFDFDGTVADTMPFLSDLAVTIICKYYDVDEIFAKENYVQTTGLPFEQQIQSIFPGNTNNSRVIREFEELKEKNYLHFKPVPHVKEVLSYLKGKGYHVAISSSTLQPLVTEYVKTYQLPCDLALGYRPNFRKGKDHFDWILRTFRMNRENLCYIGDSVNDYRLANMNNIPFIAKIGLFSQDAFYQLEQEMTMVHHIEELRSIF